MATLNDAFGFNRAVPQDVLGAFRGEPTRTPIEPGTKLYGLMTEGQSEVLRGK